MHDSRERTPSSRGRAAGFVLLFLALGAILGTLSKYLDTKAINELPDFLQQLDIINFLGRLSVWIFLAVLIACLSGSPFRAAWYVPAFFLGMVASYYLYSKFVAGFFPRNYAMIWFGLTLASAFLAFLCWYARGDSLPAVFISAAILALMFDLTFAYGAFYIDLISPLELILFLATVFLLRKRGAKIFLTAGLALAMALLLHQIHPFY